MHTALLSYDVEIVDAVVPVSAWVMRVYLYLTNLDIYVLSYFGIFH